MSGKTVHFLTSEPAQRGYLRDYLTFACGIESEKDTQDIARTYVHQEVTCDWCAIALEKAKDKPVTHRELEERVVNMSFDNSGLKQLTADFKAGQEASMLRLTQMQAESHRMLEQMRALNRELDLKMAQRPLSKLGTTVINCTHNEMPVANEDFRQEFKGAVKEAVAELVQTVQFREDLKAIFKEADDEIEADYEANEAEEFDAKRKEDMREAVREVLGEFAGQFAPQQSIYKFKQTMDPEALAETVKQAFKDATYELDAEHDEADREWAKNNVHRALREHIELPGFQRRFKGLVKDAIDEEQQANEEEYADFFQENFERAMFNWEVRKRQEAAARWAGRLSGLPIVFHGDANVSSPGGNLIDAGDAIEDHSVLNMEVKSFEEPLVHYRKLYHSKAVCGDDTGLSRVRKTGITCRFCINEISPPIPYN